MKKLSVRIVLAICCVWTGWISSGSAQKLPFPIGEELIYTITWNAIPVAWSKSVTQMDTYEGRPVVALRMTTETYAFFDHIYKVVDFHESLIDPETLLPIRYVANIREGSYSSHEVTTFDYTTMQAHHRQMGSGVEKTYTIKPDARDILSQLYFLRSIELKPNSKSQYSVMTDEKVYDLFLTTLGIKSISLPKYVEDVASIEVKPEASFDGLFVKNGKATVWISRDSRHLMTLARLSVPFGRVSVTLSEVNGPGDDFWITKKEQ
ncbi:MAG: DUF3108 domain-containing protein [Kiritimatiellaceae bacterium]|nr:DUF3108 domain-containing protein [Kiritimatiellaceae bacterium]